MEAIFAVIILAVVAFGVFIVTKSDAGGLGKAVLILVVCVFGVIGGSLLYALMEVSAVFACVVALLAAAFIVGLVKGFFGDFLQNKKFEKKNIVAKEVSKAPEEEILKSLKDIKAGDTVTFGKYRWIAAQTEEDRVMLVTDRVIMKKNLHKTDETVTWEKCSLRKYLNGSFLNNSFGEGEKNLIMSSKIQNCEMSGKAVTELPETADKIFLWRYDEVNKYIKTAKCPTPEDGDSKCWTRTTDGMWAFTYSCVHGTGSWMNDSNSIVTARGIRPVMWVRIK